MKRLKYLHSMGRQTNGDKSARGSDLRPRRAKQLSATFQQLHPLKTLSKQGLFVSARKRQTPEQEEATQDARFTAESDMAAVEAGEAAA